MYSLVQTARANELEPYAYLCRLFAELPVAQTVEQIEALLPWKHQILKPGNGGEDRALTFAAAFGHFGSNFW
jgi:hypothetical protein